MRDRTEAEARHVSAQLRVGLGESFEPLRRIAAWWLLKGKPDAPEDWETDAQLFVRSKAGLQKTVWLDARGIEEWSVGTGAQPEFKQITKLDDPLAAALAYVRQTGGDAFSPVFSSDGALLVYECVPIRKDGHRAGYIAGLYDFDELVQSLLESQGPEQYAVTVIADGRSTRLRGPRAAQPHLARDVRVRVANAAWSVRVTPAFGAYSGLPQTVTGFGVLGSVLLWVLAAIARISRRHAKDLETANARLVIENQERRRAEEKVAELNRDLQRNLHEFQTLLEVLPVGIAVADDPECRRIWTNRELAKMLNVPLGANISRFGAEAPDPHYQMLRNGVEVPLDELPMQTAVRTKAPVANDYLDIVRADGSVLRTLSYAAPVFDETGQVRGVIDVCVDITERKALEDRLQQAERFQSLALMAGGIAHDFNNLLTVIIGNASAVISETPEWGRSRRALCDLQSAAMRAAELVAQLLAFTGRFWCEVTPVALSREIEALKAVIRDMVPASVAVDYDLAEDLPLMQAAPAELQKVVESLVANAVESLPEDRGGRIEIRTSQCELSVHDIEIFYPDQRLRPGPYVRLEVSDDGCGIPDEILGRVFDPFFTTKFVGRGLGLSAVHGIVRAHGGAIRLNSALHHGTQVELIFPVYAGLPSKEGVKVVR